MGVRHNHAFNCGSTDCPKPVQYVQATATAPCKHLNGWYGTVKFWIFSKEVFVCTDCDRLMPADE